MLELDDDSITIKKLLIIKEMVFLAANVSSIQPRNSNDVTCAAEPDNIRLRQKIKHSVECRHAVDVHRSQKAKLRCQIDV